jgi:hypothetical protein
MNGWMCGWMDGWMFVQITIVDVKTMLKTNIVIRIMSVKVKQAKIEVDWRPPTICV